MSTERPGCWQPEEECMDREDLEQLQLERLEATLSRVHRSVPFYRKRFDAVGFDPDDLRSADDLRRLPFTTKADLRESYPYGLFAVPLREVVRLHASGGTGTSAVVVGYTRNDIRTWSSLMARMLVAGGVTRDDVVQITFDYGLAPGAFGVHYAAERLGASVIPTSSGNSRRQVLIMQDYKTTALVSTAGYALHLVETMIEMGVNPNALSLRRVLVGGEPSSREARRSIERQLNVTVTDNYSLSEVMGPGIAGECLQREGLHVNEDHFLVEVVDPETLERVRPGQRGELVLTTLTREAFPLIRYRTRDLTSVLAEPCPCGRTSARIRGIEARSDDMLVIKSVNVYPSQVEAVLRQVQGAEPQYQIVLERRGALDQATVLVAVSGSPDPVEGKPESELRRELRRRLASELGVTVEVKLLEEQALRGALAKGKVLDLRGR